MQFLCFQKLSFSLITQMSQTRSVSHSLTGLLAIASIYPFVDRFKRYLWFDTDNLTMKPFLMVAGARTQASMFFFLNLNDFNDELSFCGSFGPCFLLKEISSSTRRQRLLFDFLKQMKLQIGKFIKVFLLIFVPSIADS